MRFEALGHVTLYFVGFHALLNLQENLAFCFDFLRRMIETQVGVFLNSTAICPLVLFQSASFHQGVCFGFSDPGMMPG